MKKMANFEKELGKLGLLVEKHMHKYIKQKNEKPEIIYRAARYSLFAGGKRLRPILALMTAKACGRRYDDVMPLACSMEMIHTYSLIHDDLPAMDNDDYRRGKLTSHKKFGEAVAILAGDALLTKAFEVMLLSYKIPGVKTQNVISASSEIVRAAGMNGMVGGQVIDITSEGKNISFEELKYLHKCKTGALIKASVTAPAILFGASNIHLKYYKQYGEKIGLAFQIVDDILDVTGDAAKLGKKTGKDSTAHKATYPSIFGLDRSKEIAGKLVVEACAILGKIDGDTSGLKDIAEFFMTRNY
jgi:geranylgeranyl diphosphate synthase type II